MFGGSSNEIVDSNQNVEQGIIVQHLEQLKEQYAGRLSVDYFVDEERTFIGKKDVQRCLDAAPSSPTTEELRTKKVKCLILVSGPDGFVQFFAGPKQWENGGEVQGPLGGLLRSIDLRGWDVWKL